MRTLCDVCESAAATLFCAADEAALCVGCDEKVHLCNKLASRHIRVGLAAPNDVPRCDICETTPAFFYCEIDGTSLCLQCDTIVHVGGKRSHERYLLLRQRVEFPVDKSAHSEDLALHPTDPSNNRREPNHLPKMTMRENVQNHKMPSAPTIDAKTDIQHKMDTKMIDLNIRPNGSHGTHGQASSNQDQGMDVLSGGNHESHSYDPARLSQR